jgi:uncharacterized protein
VITEGHLVRHYQGRCGGRGPALIDIAQDHLLFHLAENGLFDLDIALKGGTAIRKLWAGNAGRFSTDLDFAGLDDAGADLVIEVVDGASVGPFSFTIEPIDGTLRVAVVITNTLGSAEVPARLDLVRRPLWLGAAARLPVALPIHERYDFVLPLIPAAVIEEVIAEKLARYRRSSLARDLYDLAWFASRVFDRDLVRRLTIMKVWCDVVDDRLGEAPFDPEQVLRRRDENEFRPEAIGYLTTPVDIPAWVDTVSQRYVFLREMNEFERTIALCSKGDEWLVRQAVADLGPSSSPAEDVS